MKDQKEPEKEVWDFYYSDQSYCIRRGDGLPILHVNGIVFTEKVRHGRKPQTQHAYNFMVFSGSEFTTTTG